MTAGLRYIETIRRLADEALATQAAGIAAAAELIADAIGAGGMLHAFGTGHSHMLAEELFYRAGGLVRVNPILEDSLMLHRGAALSTELERLEGLAAALLKRQPVRAGDALLIASNSGRNVASVEMALEAQALGLKVIAVTSLRHAASVASRHPSGLKLHEACDVCLDNLGEPGDASIAIDGVPTRVAPTSTAIGAMLVNAVVAEAVERLVGRGETPELFASSNGDGGDAHNRALIERYKGVIRCL